MSLNYSIMDTIKLIGPVIKNSMFIAILLSVIILSIIYIYNNKVMKYISLVLSIFGITTILYYYFDGIISLNFKNPINNIYFYFFNSIIYLIISVIVFFKGKYKTIDYIFYCLAIINLSYSIFMTHYLYNYTMIVIGNIFPMIKFGNILYICYYLILSYYMIKRVLRR